MEQLPRHTQYKESGLPWVGEIPEHWQTARLRYVARIGNGTTPSRDRFDYWNNGTVPWLASGQVNDYIVQRAREFVTLQAVKETSLRMLPAGSVILGMVGQGKTRGMSAYLAIDATINQNLAGITPTEDLNGRYLHYMLVAAYDFQRNCGRGGNQAALNCSIVGSFPSLLPPRPEQDQIVAYLRAQDAHIAKYIKAKRELIKLLTEQKLRIIDHAVTRGLDPTVALKPSGVEWLGEVPEHWEVMPLKRACTRFALYGANVPATYYTDVGVRFLRTTDILDSGQLKLGGVFLPGNVVSDYLLADGDILLSRSGTIGRSFLYRVDVHGQCSYAGYLVRFSPAEFLFSDFLLYYTKTRAFADFVKLNAISTTIENLNGDKYARMMVPVPQFEEQKAICRWITDQCLPLDEAITSAEEEIKLIREYRDRLIADVVTGQVDVRGWQPGPDDVVDDAALAALGDDAEDVDEEEEGDGGS